MDAADKPRHVGALVVELNCQQTLVLPDLQRTEKKHWWMGRPLRVRIHLGVYILQQMFNLTDRVTEQQVRDNAAFQLFCGYGLIKKWHAPDHTKIEAFRSRLSPETQRRLAIDGPASSL